MNTCPDGIAGEGLISSSYSIRWDIDVSHQIWLILGERTCKSHILVFSVSILISLALVADKAVVFPQARNVLITVDLQHVE